jgi:hypothetical protein
MDRKVPEGGDAWPDELSPQHLAALAVVNAHAKFVPAETATKTPAGGEA